MNSAGGAAGGGDDGRAGAAIVLWVAVAAALWLVAYAIAAVLPADPGPAAPEAIRQFLLPAQYIRPEPTERRIFLVCLFLLPALAAVGARLVAKNVVRLRSGMMLAIPAVAAGLATLVTNTRAMEFLRGDRGAVPFAVAIALAVAWTAASARSRNAPRWARSAAFAAAALAAAWLSFSWRTFDVHALQSTARHDQHLDAVLYTVNEATKGRVPMADYSSQYGFFGALLAPWFRIIGLTVLSLTATLNALQAIALLAITAFAFRLMRHAAFAAAACAMIFYFANSWLALTPDPDPYFQYAPIRLLFPMVSALLAAEWLRRPRVWTGVAIAALGGVAIVWNLDSGIAVTGAWLILLGYRTFAAFLSREDWRTPARTVSLAVVAAALPVLVFLTWVRIRAGAPVDFGVWTQSQRMFYGTGFYMLAMPSGQHPWMLVAAMLAFGVVIGTLRVFGVLRDDRSYVFLHLALLGCGLFPYYQGRSHDRVLIYVAWPAILIAFLAADWAWTLAKARRVRLKVTATVVTPVLAFGALCGVFLATDTPGVVHLLERRTKGTVATPWFAEGLTLIRANTRGSSEAVVLAKFQGAYLTESGLSSAIRGPGFIEVITRSQADGVITQIKTKLPDRVFLSPASVDLDGIYGSLTNLLLREYRLAGATPGGELQMFVRR